MKRARVHVMHGKEGFVTIGPFTDSKLSPLHLFESLLANTLPTMNLSRPYSVHLDPVFPYYLRVTLDSVSDAKTPVAA